MRKRNETGRKKMNRRRETLETRGKQMERNRMDEEKQIHFVVAQGGKT